MVLKAHQHQHLKQGRWSCHLNGVPAACCSIFGSQLPFFACGHVRNLGQTAHCPTLGETCPSYRYESTCMAAGATCTFRPVQDITNPCEL